MIQQDRYGPGQQQTDRELDCLAQSHPLTRTLTANLIFVTRHLQSKLQWQLLHGLQHDAGNAVGLNCEIRHINDARHR